MRKYNNDRQTNGEGGGEQAVFAVAGVRDRQPSINRGRKVPRHSADTSRCGVAGQMDKEAEEGHRQFS